MLLMISVQCFRSLITLAIVSHTRRHVGSGVSPNCPHQRSLMGSLDSFIRRVAAPPLVLSDTDVCRVSKLNEVLKSFLPNL
jgi:hypothetical protein